MDHKEFKEWQDLKIDKRFNNRLYKIYGLIDPRNNTLFYIGCTSISLHIRLGAHILLPDGSDKKNELLSLLLKNNVFPEVVLFYSLADKKNARIAEKYIIHFLKNICFKIDLANMNGTKNITENINIKR